MCGIAGIFDPTPRAEPLGLSRSAERSRRSLGTKPRDEAHPATPHRYNLQPALSALSHRGPDDAGWWDDNAIALGARRLAIIDLLGGNQPLANEDGQIIAVHNGEIYNYVELIAELERLGHRFRTRCDTEVLVHAWEEWGATGVERLRGMFAFAIYDRRQRSLFLARDRFGIKPLYVARQNNLIAFASELPALLALLPERPRLNPRPLAHLLSLGWLPGPSTLYDGIEHLPPAHSLLITPGSPTFDITLRCYWQPTPPPAAARLSARDEAHLDRPTDWAEQLTALLQESVNLHLRSDVPVGALLSGGLDSSVLTALAQRGLRPELRPRGLHPDPSAPPLHTFHIGFDDPTYDETPHARLVAQHLGVQHHTLRFDPSPADSGSAFDLLPDLTTHYGQPVGSATHVAIWLLYRACAQVGLKVILTGEGADELFGGYRWYSAETRLTAARRWPAPLRLLASFTSPLLGISPAAAEILRHPDLPLLERYRRWLTPHTPADALAWLHPDLHQHIDASLPWQAPSPDLHPHHALTLLDLQSRLPDFINLEVDHMSMAHSVEARVPFLDHRLWETVLAWNPRLDYNGSQEKGMLRQIAAPLLPPAITRRRKQGLASPHARWWSQARLPVWAEDRLQTDALARVGLFPPAAVAALRAAHQSGRVNYATPLTAILTTQIWAETKA